MPPPAASRLCCAVLGLHQNETEAVSEETELPQFVFPLPPATTAHRLSPVLAAPSAHGRTGSRLWRDRTILSLGGCLEIANVVYVLFLDKDSPSFRWKNRITF